MLGHILWTAINAVLPIILLIGVGYVLKRMGRMNDVFIKTGRDLVFMLFLPCMLFINIYDIPGLDAIQWDVAIYCLIMVLVMFGIGFVAGNLTTKDLRRKGVVWQCAFRSNFAIIGLPLANSLGGAAGAGVAAVVTTFTVPLYNVLSIICLSTYVSQNGKEKRSAGQFIKEVVTNPLTVGVLLGLAVLLIRGAQEMIFGEVVFSLKRDAEFVYETLCSLKALASPLALIVLGGQCEFSAVKGLKKEILVSTILRIVVAPLLAVGGAVILNAMGLLRCSNAEFAALVAQFGSPVAVSSAVVASAMDNDEQLAAQLVVWTSIGSTITIFLTVCILMSAGLLIL